MKRKRDARKVRDERCVAPGCRTPNYRVSRVRVCEDEQGPIVLPVCWHHAHDALFLD